MNEFDILVKKAIEARKNSYCPYSSFAVGAALLCQDGSIYTGCNVECSSYSATNCAERTAIFKAISEGKRKFSAIAVVGGGKEDSISQICVPCGICLQVLAEFCDAKFKILLISSIHQYTQTTLGELLPTTFRLSSLKEGSCDENV